MGEGNLQPGNSLTLAESGNVVFTSRSNDRRQSSTAPKVFALQRNGRTRLITKTKKNGDGNTENAERCEVNLMPKCVYQGSMKITAIEKEN